MKNGDFMATLFQVGSYSRRRPPGTRRRARRSGQAGRTRLVIRTRAFSGYIKVSPHIPLTHNGWAQKSEEVPGERQHGVGDDEVDGRHPVAAEHDESVDAAEQGAREDLDEQSEHVAAGRLRSGSCFG